MLFNANSIIVQLYQVNFHSASSQSVDRHVAPTQTHYSDSKPTSLLFLLNAEI